MSKLFTYTKKLSHINYFRQNSARYCLFVWLFVLLHANFPSMYPLHTIPQEIKKSRMTKTKFDHTGYRPI